MKMGYSSSVALLALLMSIVVLCNGGKTSTYVRNLIEKPVDMPLDSDAFAIPPGYNAPQQVHITQGDLVGQAMIISWVTVDEPGSNEVIYWSDSSLQNFTAEGQVFTYTYYNYTSGFIHHTTITNLEFNTKYYYEVGIGNTTRQFWFITPPEVGLDVPYTFGIIGDLGQTFDSNTTLTHYQNSNGTTLLYVGDLSYADDYPNHDNVRWDTWGRFTERSAAYQPWIWTAGNHEIDFDPQIGETQPFKPFSNRYHTPYEASQSTEPYYYSIKRGSAHIIVLASYSAYGTSTLQYKWLTSELPKVNRTETSWLIVLMHAPCYARKCWLLTINTINTERVSNDKYNITNGICTPVKDISAPVYITNGDGGNLEGLATNMTQPQPSYSAYREASFGHGTLYIKNRTHAHYSWNRNQDGYAVEADKLWLFNRYWNPLDDSTTHIP
ncbi:hypothetical protein TanjilG_23185 [Lupinus angustifolius]|uniref:Purple acid phosphatase n=1 Tax=Lupinus angustifolius TaxID=3871 RepID=A0A394DCE9_LUPAN|nr:hypothetical protein TanjilG_23185 [Lupinus angustifolius]